MNRRDLMKVLATLAGSTAASQLMACSRPRAETVKEASSALSVYPPNFGLLNSDGSWRSSWTHIVPGKFTPSSISTLFFYEGSTGYGEFWATNGFGGLSGTAPLGTYTAATPGFQIWTHIVPGYFGPSGFMGLLFYDQRSGNAAFYDSDGKGTLKLLRTYSGWRTSWTHIVPGYFASPAVWNNVQTSETYTDLFFYSPSEGQAEIWTTDGTGTIRLKDGMTYNVPQNCTHVAAGDFCANSDFDQYTDLILYQDSGFWYLFYTRFGGTGTVLVRQEPGDSLPAGLSAIVPGHFGGTGSCDIALFTASTGALSFRTLVFDPTQDPTKPGYQLPTWRELETGTYPRSTASIVVPGNFWMPDPDEHWFFDGDNQNNEQLRSWRASAGGFAGLLFYNASLSLGETYFHEPVLPPPDPLTGYATSTTQHANGVVSTGSVLPGETVSFHVSSQVGSYSITIVRADDPNGTALWSKGPSVVYQPPLGVPRVAYKEGAQWPAVASFSVPAGWTSGLYLARVRATSTSDQLDIPFIVRSPNPGQNAIMVVIADASYEAYNDWGGRSVYGYSTVADGEPANPTDFASRGAVYPQGGMRAPYALTVSFDRAHDGRYETHGHKWTYWEKPLLTWLSEQGFTVDVCTMRDIHFEAPSPNYRLLVFAGHPEYWSRAMRDNVQHFAAYGGNVAFMSGNVSWWQVRISDDGTAMTCCKNRTFDPLAPAFQFLTTVNWEAAPVNYPETSLTGVSYEAGGGLVTYPGPTPFFVARGAENDTLLRGCVLGPFGTFGLYAGGTQSVVGSETDRIQPTTPRNFVKIAFAEINGGESASMGYFSTSAGVSRTFTTATMNWTLGLSLDGGWTAVDQISLNILSESLLGPDLFYGAAVSVFSSYEAQGISSANLTDGNRQTFYSSQLAENDPSKAVNHTEWAVIQMPAQVTFSKVVLYPRNDGQWVGQGFPIDFRIQVWDGLEWLDRVVVTGAPLPGAAPQVFSWGFSDWTDRIRILATNLRTVVPADGYLLQLAQISVHA